MHQLASPRRRHPLVSYDELSKAATVATFLRGGLRTGKVNEVALNRYRGLDTDGIIDLVARNQRPSGLPSGFKGGIALTDGTIHQQTSGEQSACREPSPNAGSLRPSPFRWEPPRSLPRATPRPETCATDVDWTVGDGPVVTGPGEALLMAAAGRAAALADLSGDGLPTLRERVAKL